jgi:hypothetical protein
MIGVGSPHLGPRLRAPNLPKRVYSILTALLAIAAALLVLTFLRQH